MELKWKKIEREEKYGFLLIAPLMELKYAKSTRNSKTIFAFNRTAYGIEILHLYYVLVFCIPFNRTAYGIEIAE